jgi:hypothetical protein
MGRIRHFTLWRCVLRIVGVLCLDRLANESRQREDDDVLLSPIAARGPALRAHGSNVRRGDRGRWLGGWSRYGGDPWGSR